MERNFPSKFGTYFEPFLGGGAVMFHMLSKNPNLKCHVSDLNSDLILAYIAIRDKVDELIESLVREDHVEERSHVIQAPQEASDEEVRDEVLETLSTPEPTAAMPVGKTPEAPEDVDQGLIEGLLSPDVEGLPACLPACLRPTTHTHTHTLSLIRPCSVSKPKHAGNSSFLPARAGGQSVGLFDLQLWKSNSEKTHPFIVVVRTY